MERCLGKILIFLSVFFGVFRLCHCVGPAQCGVFNCQPKNIHLALTGKTTELVVSWLTIGHPATSTVQYGLSSGKLQWSAVGKQSSYLESDDGDIVMWNHHVVLSELKEDTRYFYRCGDPIAGWSKEFSFKTPPPPPTSSRTNLNTTIIVYGDMGIVASQNTAPRVAHLAQTGGIDFIYHVGDISYADDYPGGMYEEVWDTWFQQIEPAATVVPYMVLPGNHEYSCDHEGCDYSVNFTAYNNRFLMPGLASGSNTNMWYSFDYANIHFVSISTETDFPNAPEGMASFGNQLQWLEQDLAKANQRRDTHPWIIVGGHRPIYCSSWGFELHGNPIGIAANIQKAFEEILYRYKVDLVLTGHVHAYERMWPVYRNKSTGYNYDDPKSPVYIVVGTAGSTEGQFHIWVDPQPEWSVIRIDKHFGFAIMEVYQKDNKNILEWRFLTSKEGDIKDKMILTKTIPKS